jgi:hypothetical protein
MPYKPTSLATLLAPSTADDAVFSTVCTAWSLTVCMPVTTLSKREAEATCNQTALFYVQI